MKVGGGENGDQPDLASAAAGLPTPPGPPTPGDPLSGASEPARRPTRATRWDKSWPKDPAAPGQTVEPEEETSPKTKSQWRTPLRLAGLLIMLVIIAIALKGKLPKPLEIWNAIGTAQWAWVFVGVVAMAVSIFAFAEQQKQLLEAFDTTVGRRRIVVITLGGTALTNSLPAGAAVAAAFSFTQYRQSGANRSTAATVMVLSGLLSVGSLALLYFLVIGAATATPFISLVTGNPLVAVLIVLALVGLILLLLRRIIAGTPDEISDEPTPRLDRWEGRWPRIGALARDGLETFRQARLVRIKYLSLAIGWSVVKWATEAVCLLVSCWAFGIHIDLVAMSVIYLSVQLVRQIPFTPGGIGLVEASLLAGLVSAGALHGPAGAAVLVYRLLSAWMIIPIGFALLAELKRRDAKRSALLTDATES